MDLTEATSIVFNRIQQVEPDYVTKIIGCLLLRDRTNQEMIRLALGTDKSIEEAIHNAKMDLGLASNSPPTVVIRPEHPVSFGPRNMKYYYHQLSGYNFDQLRSRYQVQNQNPHQSDYYHKLAMRRRNPPPIKTYCHYYNRGFCKHGDNCKYVHDELVPRRAHKSLSNIINEDDDKKFPPPGSLEKLEMEIVDILKSRRCPISIASLPMIYLERYRKSLQAEGYLTESQRHGKTGHSLTRLLSRITSITLIDRPHGQHFIVLAEDASKYFHENRGGGGGGENSSKSRQIYLTFPAESPFTEDDVANYFSNFGAVEDVRIPCQNKRMFGFVTFLDSDTVHMILSKGNPHYICGARVLVKPYKERSKLNDRKYHDRMEYRFHFPQQYVDPESDFDSSMPISYETSKFLQRVGIEAFRLAELELAIKNHHQSCSNNNINGLKVAQDCLNVQSGQGFSYWFGLLNAENEKNRMVEKNIEDDSQINLPESPFAAALANTISNLM